MAKPRWQDVAQNPQFHALSPAEREAVKQQYFQDNIAPLAKLHRVPVQDVWAQFSTDADETTAKIMQPMLESPPVPDAVRRENILAENERKQAQYAKEMEAINERGLLQITAESVKEMGQDGLGILASGGNAFLRTANMLAHYSPFGTADILLAKARGTDTVYQRNDRAYREGAQAIREFETPEMQQSLRNISEAEGVAGTLAALVQNPRGAIHMVGEQIPQFGLTGGAMKVATTGLTGAKALAAGVAANRGMASAQSAGDAGNSAFDAMYQHAKAQGLSDAEAEAAGERARRVAAPIGAGLGFAIGGIGAKAESGLLARVLGTEGVEQLTRKQAAVQIPTLLAKEIAEEALDEGLSSQMASNIGEMVAGNKERGLFDDVPESAALGGALGGIMGGGMALKTAAMVKQTGDLKQDLDAIIAAPVTPLGADPTLVNQEQLLGDLTGEVGMPTQAENAKLLRMAGAEEEAAPSIAGNGLLARALAGQVPSGAAHGFAQESKLAEAQRAELGGELKRAEMLRNAPDYGFAEYDQTPGADALDFNAWKQQEAADKAMAGAARIEQIDNQVLAEQIAEHREARGKFDVPTPVIAQKRTDGAAIDRAPSLSGALGLAPNTQQKIASSGESNKVLEQTSEEAQPEAAKPFTPRTFPKLKPDSSKHSALQLIALAGGVKPDSILADDLRAALGIEKGKNMRVPGTARFLFSPNAKMSVDDAAQRLWEHGLIPEHDAMDMLGRLHDQGDFHGADYHASQAATDEARLASAAEKDQDQQAEQVQASAGFDVAMDAAALEDDGFNDLAAVEQAEYLQHLARITQADIDALQADYYAEVGASPTNAPFDELIAFTEEKLDAPQNHQPESARSGSQDHRESRSAEAAKGTGATAQAGGFQLEGLTESQARTEASAREREAQAQRQREAAPAADDFTLTGSDRAADVAAAHGAQDLFSAPVVKENLTTETQAAAPADSTKSKPDQEAKPSSGKASGDPVADNPERDQENTAPADAGVSVSGDQKKRQKMGDVGEKLAGAKKDLWQRQLDALSDETLDIAAAPLSKTFPEPDYAKLAANGADRDALAFVAMLRNEIPAKPQKSYKLAAWVKKVGELRAMASLLIGSRNAYTWMKEQADAGGRLTGSIRDMVATAEAIRNVDPSNIKEAAKWRIRSRGGFSQYYDLKLNPSETMYWVEDEKGRSYFEFDGHERGIYGTDREQVIERAAQAIAAHLEKSAVKPKERRYTPLDLYKDRATREVFVGFKGANGVVRVQSGFESFDEARKYANDNKDALQDKIDRMREEPDVRRPDNLPRVGPSHRDGDVSAGLFAETFGFRGVQFGNYVEAGRDQAEINEAFDALMDMAGELALPPRALSLNGTLGMAFGARGSGNAKAHFEPDNVVINITKTKGAGSLAHEWLHSLDHYFSRQNQGKESAKHGGFITDGERADGVRPEVHQAFNELMQTIGRSDFAARSRQRDDYRSKPYWGTNIEMAARAFERYIADRIERNGGMNDYLVNLEKTSGVYPTAEELETQGIKAAFDKLFSTIEHEETADGNVRLFSRGANLFRAPEVRNADGKLLAPNGQPSKLNEHQWHQVRSPEFKAWFGDWEALSAQKRLDAMTPVRVNVPHDWRGLDVNELRARVKLALIELVESGEPLHHAQLGDVSLSKRGVKKALSSSADPAKLKVLADLRNVFEQSIFASASAVHGDKPNVAAYEKLLAKIDVAGNEMVAVFSVEKHADGRLFYNTVTLDSKEKAPAASPQDTLSQEGEERATSANTGADSFSRQVLQKVNLDSVSKVVDANGEPLVVYHGTRREFDVFAPSQPRGAHGNPKGIYFSGDKRTAEEYAQDVDGAVDVKSRVVSAYVNIKDNSDGRIKDSLYSGAEYIVFDPVNVKSAIGNSGAFDGNNPSILASESAPQQVGTTVSEVRAELIKAFGARRVEGMERTGAVKIVQSERDVPGTSEPIQSDDGYEDPSAQGFYDPISNSAYLVADGLAPNEVRSTMLHEGVHWLEHNRPELMARVRTHFTQQMDAAMRFDDREGAISKWFRTAWRRVPPSTPHKHVLSEIMAYSVTNYVTDQESAPVSMRKWLGDFVAGIRVALIRMGWNPKEITPADMAALARYAVRKMGKTESLADKMVNLVDRGEKQWGKIPDAEGMASKTGVEDYHAGPVVDLWRKVAGKEGAFATKRTSKSNLEDIVQEILPGQGMTFERVESLEVPKEGRSAPGFVVRDGDFNKVLQVFDADSQRPFIEIGNEQVSLGENLGKLYQALAGWANNTGKTLRVDPRGLSTINELRRSEQIISAMLKYDNAGMFDVDGTQFAGLLSEGDFRDYEYYGKTDSIMQKLESLKNEYWGVDQSPQTSKALTDARINNLAVAAAALAKRRAPGAFENANLDSTGNVRERNDQGEMVALDDKSGRLSAEKSQSYLLGVGYSVRQRAYATLQSVFGGKIPALVDGASLRRAGALQSIGQQATPNRHERAGLSHPRQDALAEAGTLRLYSKAATDPGQDAGVSTSEGIDLKDQGWLDRQVAKVQNNLNRVREIQDKLGLAEWAGFYGAAERMPGRTASRLEDLQNQILKPIAQELAAIKRTPEQLSTLLHAMHAKERNAQVASVNPSMPDGGSGMSNAEADAILKSYKDDAQLHALADKLRAVTRRTLDAKLAYGLIDQATHDRLTQHYQYYVPLKGDQDSKRTGSGYSVGRGDKRAMGHNGRDEMILENVAMDAERAIAQGEKNLALQQFLMMARQFKDSKLWTIGEIPKSRSLVEDNSYAVHYSGAEVATFDTLSEAKAFIERDGRKNKRTEQSYEIVTERGEKVREFALPLQDNEVRLYVAGREVRIQIHDAVLAEQMRKLNTEQLNAFLEMSGAMNRWFATVYTGKNPDFILKNMARDSITGTFNNIGNMGFGGAAKAWGSYKQATKALYHFARTGEAPDTETGQYLAEYRQHGGKTGASHISDLEAHKNNLLREYEDAKGAGAFAEEGRVGKAAWVATRKTIGALADVVDAANVVTENALRLSTFIAARKMGKSAEQAASLAKNVTVNFDRKGSATPLLGALYLFLNPAVQGTANAYKTLTRSEYKEQAWAALGALAGAGVFIAAMGMDDDEDKWLGESFSQRTRNIIVRVGDKAVRIPMSQELAPVYAFGVAIAEMAYGQKPGDSAIRLASSALDAWFPRNVWDPDSDNHAATLGLALVPTAISPLAETALNRDGLGRKIVPKYDRDEGAPDNRFMNRNTRGTLYDKAAQGLAAAGEAMGAGRYEDGLSKVSPESLRHVFRAYAGGLGAFLVDTGMVSAKLATGEAIKTDDVPIVKSWVRTDTRDRGRFYALKDEAADAAKQLSEARKKGDGDEMQRLYDTKRDLLQMHRLMSSQAKALRLLRDAADLAMQDESLNAEQKGKRLEALARQEAVLYRDTFAAIRGQD